MNRRIQSIFLLVLILFTVSGCQQNVPISTDPKDSDFSAAHPEVIAGDGFTIQPDVRVYTLYAYLNAVAGWKEEYGDGFSPQRQALIEDVQARLAQVDAGKVETWRKFYESHHQHPFNFLYYTMALGTPPEFNLIIPMSETERSGVFRSLNGFNTILAEFYQEAGLQELFEKRFRDLMMEDVRAYDSEAISRQMGEVYQYTRLDRETVQDFDLVIIPNPFDTHYSAMSIGYQKRLYIIDGPGSNDQGLNVHEYLHKLMDEILPADLAGQKSKFDKLLKQNINSKYVKGNYEEVRIFVEEALVRALDYRIRETTEPGFHSMAKRKVAEEAAGGLVLEDDFYEALPDFEQNSSLTLRDFLSETLKTIPGEQ